VTFFVDIMVCALDIPYGALGPTGSMLIVPFVSICEGVCSCATVALRKVTKAKRTRTD
jgi:hypothetical protein